MQNSIDSLQRHLRDLRRDVYNSVHVEQEPPFSGVDMDFQLPGEGRSYGIFPRRPTEPEMLANERPLRGVLFGDVRAGFDPAGARTSHDRLREDRELVPTNDLFPDSRNRDILFGTARDGGDRGGLFGNLIPDARPTIPSNPAGARNDEDRTDNRRRGGLFGRGVLFGTPVPDPWALPANMPTSSRHTDPIDDGRQRNIPLENFVPGAWPSSNSTGAHNGNNDSLPQPASISRDNQFGRMDPATGLSPGVAPARLDAPFDWQLRFSQSDLPEYTPPSPSVSSPHAHENAESVARMFEDDAPFDADQEEYIFGMLSQGPDRVVLQQEEEEEQEEGEGAGDRREHRENRFDRG